MPTDPEMEEDLVVVDDSDLDGTRRHEEIVRRTTSCRQRHPSPVSGVPVLERAPGDAKGKTPYTITMRLKKGPKGFGFSVTWTHPPRYASLIASFHAAFLTTFEPGSNGSSREWPQIKPA